MCWRGREREREICRLYALAAAPSITQRPRRFDGSVGIATPRNKHAWMYAHMMQQARMDVRTWMYAHMMQQARMDVRTHAFLHTCILTLTWMYAHMHSYTYFLTICCVYAHMHSYATSTHGCTHTCILTQTDLQTPSRKPARCKGARPGVSVSTHEAKDCSIKNIDFRAGPLIHCTGALYYGHECDHGV